MQSEIGDWFIVDEWPSCVYDKNYNPTITSELMGRNRLVHKVNFNTKIKFNTFHQCSKFEFKTGSIEQYLWTIKCYLHQKPLYNCIAFGLVSLPNTSVNISLSFSPDYQSKLKTYDQTFLNNEKRTIGRNLSENEIGAEIYLRFELNVYEDINDTSFFGSYNNNIISNRFKHFVSKDFDVTIHGNDYTFKAHKDILCKFSEVFQNMFSSDMSEANSGKINITEFSSETILAMLQYIYTGKINKLNDVCDELVKLSHKYEMEELKQICLSCIYPNLSLENFVKYFNMADLYDFIELKDKCREFLKESNNMMEIIRREDWSSIVAKPENKSLLCFLFKHFNNLTN